MCEGSKTEPLYLGEIRQQLRLPSANVQVQPAAYGTEPLRIVEYAERLFTEGQRALGIHARSFDRVVVVFDRDEHSPGFGYMWLATPRARAHTGL